MEKSGALIRVCYNDNNTILLSLLSIKNVDFNHLTIQITYINRIKCVCWDSLVTGKSFHALFEFDGHEYL